MLSAEQVRGIWHVLHLVTGACAVHRLVRLPLGPVSAWVRDIEVICGMKNAFRRF